MIDKLTIEQAARTCWGKARLQADGVALWSTDHPYIVFGLLYGAVAYFGSAVLIGMVGRATIALMIVGPAGWWCFGRYKAFTAAQMSKLGFFSGESGPLRLSEDLLSSKVVYCIGLRNEGKKAVGNVRVMIDGIEGYSGPAGVAALPIFRSPADNADLQPGESEYFCVMRIVEGSAEGEGAAVICCQEGQAAPRFGFGELAEGRAITLSACSEGAPRTTKQIRISLKQEAPAPVSLDLELLPDIDDTPARVVEPTPVAIEPSPVAQPPLPEADTASAQVPEPSPIAPPANTETTPPPVVERAQEPSAHSERVRRLLARQGRA